MKESMKGAVISIPHRTLKWTIDGRRSTEICTNAALQQGHSGSLGRKMIIHLEDDPTSVCSSDDYMM